MKGNAALQVAMGTYNDIIESMIPFQRFMVLWVKWHVDTEILMCIDWRAKGQTHNN